MADERRLHRCVTRFMLDTCRFERTTHKDILRFSVMCTNVFDGCDRLLSGSCAEFYIRPMLSCIGDIDYMVCNNGCIAIPAGRKPPTELPPNYYRFVIVYEIIDIDQPGYVYLQPSYDLKKNDSGRYVAQKNGQVATPCWLHYEDLTRLWSTDRYKSYFVQSACKDIVQHQTAPYCNLVVKGLAFDNHGPAIQATNHVETMHPGMGSHGKVIAQSINSCSAMTNMDYVRCIRCLLWPTEAGDWPMRDRNFGWPDRATINQVVNNGCDVVGAVHPLCREDEWMSKHQMRLSFSRAEVTLLNSWSPVQQIIYHMLRYIVKREVLSKAKDIDPDLPTLCNYHIKTLMLWECEQKPQSWWSAESSLIKLCSSLLHKLADWVAHKQCQQYFISNCNLLAHFQNASVVICDRLSNVSDVSFLLNWFIENYIRECAQGCSANVSTKFDYLLAHNKSEKAIQSVVDFELNTLPRTLFIELIACETAMLTLLHTFHLDAQRILTLVKMLPEFDIRFPDYFVAVKCLRVAYTILIHSLNEDMVDILWALLHPYAVDISELDVAGCESGAFLCIKKAISLACLTTARSNALEMSHMELAKAYLHHSFTYGQESTYSVVHVLLAALYYKSGHYQTAIDHCEQALSQRDSDQYGSHCIGAEYLPQTDDNVDAVHGLILLYEHVRRNALNLDEQSQSEIKLAFTTEALASYLHSTCLSVAETNFTDVTMCRRRLCVTDLPLLSDVLLFKAGNIQLKKEKKIAVVPARTHDSLSNNKSISLDTSLLVKLLEHVALEKLITIRQSIVRELYSERFRVVNEFEVLHAYKCGLFEQCLEICRNTANMLLYSDSSKTQAYCIKYPEMIYLLDGELLSLLGIIRLLQPLTFLNFAEFPEYSYVYLLSLLLYLMAECQKKLHSDSLDATLSLIRFAHDEVFPGDKYIFSRLVLKLTYRSLKMYINDSICAD